ncbi:unnamed protein product [Cyprideis torosa]|uniref:Uncharacterized protein n=1 Tax=Cyprideis torosa TaxID=163714 RepID=A0A7R8ZK48_9CRUS|nr:unnamed protein product [Cyprideis torosa]CAG0883685.1 unnamed protein product [Cyprideis torosa]
MKFGVPYPSTYDLCVKSKMRYNDRFQSSDRRLLSGRRWYDIQAFRALNQALGRCIRHKNDWGALIVVDSRFKQASYVQSLPLWVRTRIRNIPSYQQQMEELTKFVTERLAADAALQEERDAMEVEEEIERKAETTQLVGDPLTLPSQFNPRMASTQMDSTQMASTLTLPSQFNPPMASTQMDSTQMASTLTLPSQFNPPMASTQMDSTQMASTLTLPSQFNPPMASTQMSQAWPLDGMGIGPSFEAPIKQEALPQTGEVKQDQLLDKQEEQETEEDAPLSPTLLVAMPRAARRGGSSFPADDEDDFVVPLQGSMTRKRRKFKEPLTQKPRQILAKISLHACVVTAGTSRSAMIQRKVERQRIPWQRNPSARPVLRTQRWRHQADRQRETSRHATMDTGEKKERGKALRTGRALFEFICSSDQGKGPFSSIHRTRPIFILPVKNQRGHKQALILNGLVTLTPFPLLLERPDVYHQIGSDAPYAHVK